MIKLILALSVIYCGAVIACKVSAVLIKKLPKIQNFILNRLYD